MKLTSSIIAFSLFSCSVLIGGNFYQQENQKQDISQSVYGNKKSALVSNLLKTNKDLDTVQGKINVLNFEINESNESIKTNKAREENLSRDKEKKENRIETLGEKIEILTQNSDLTSHPWRILNSHAEKIISARRKFKEIISKIQKLKEQKSSQTTKEEKQRIQIQIDSLKKELPAQRNGWRWHVISKKYSHKAKNDAENYQKRLKTEKDQSKSNLEKTEKSLADTQNSIKTLQELLETQKEDLGNFQKQKSDLSQDLGKVVQEIVEV